MVNKKLFSSKGKSDPTDCVNEAGGKAYSFSDKHAIAQYLNTGTFEGNYYTRANEQLDSLLEKIKNVDPLFLAKAAVYARNKGFMKDTPSFIIAYLSTVSEPKIFEAAFKKVITNSRMLRNFIQFIRSGVLGRRSFGSLPRRLIRNWLNEVPDNVLFNALGNDPSIADVIKMVHPKPKDKTRSALFSYIIGKTYNEEDLPRIVKDFEAFKRASLNDCSGDIEVPDVSFMRLSSVKLTKNQWIQKAMQMPWNTLRMNLNTLKRNGVFEDAEVVSSIANKISNEEVIRKVKVFPYSLLAAYKNTNGVPSQISNALQDAMEVATENVPSFEGPVAIMVDTSGSMGCPVTGYRGSVSSSVTCVDVAALFASSILRVNPDSMVIPFDTQVRRVGINPRDTVITNSEKLSRLCGGGTDCGSALDYLIKLKSSDKSIPDFGMIIYLSDNESWVDSSGKGRNSWYTFSTSTVSLFDEYKRKFNRKAKMVNIDIQPYDNSQTPERKDIINIGGFSDRIFDIIKSFEYSDNTDDFWVKSIEKTDLF